MQNSTCKKRKIPLSCQGVFSHSAAPEHAETMGNVYKSMVQIRTWNIYFTTKLLLHFFCILSYGALGAERPHVGAILKATQFVAN